MARRAAFTVLMMLLLIMIGVPTPTQAQDRLQVVATTSILADIARNVTGDAAGVTALVPLFADPHAFTPTPRDMVTLTNADLIFIVGAGFEQALADAIGSVADSANVITASNCVDILPFGSGGEAAHEDEAHHHEDEPAPESGIGALCASHHAELGAMHDEAHEAHHGPIAPLGMLYTLNCGGRDDRADEEHDHEPGTCDPHVWTDPHNAALWTLMIRDTLIARDPANADIYTANAEAYLVALDTLTEESIRPMVASIPPENRKLVTNHFAFGYYANAFGLEMLGALIPSASTLAEPSLADMARIIDQIREANIPAIFAETTANPRLAEQIVSETGTAFYTLYTGSLSEADGPAGTYLDYLRHNTQVIVEALGGTIE
jgi:ABC-type Zn uptake system ZnuABC Zn-binding protein ZnuA